MYCRIYVEYNLFRWKEIAAQFNRRRGCSSADYVDCIQLYIVIDPVDCKISISSSLPRLMKPGNGAFICRLNTFNPQSSGPSAALMAMPRNEAARISSTLQVSKVHPCMEVRAVGGLISIRTVRRKTDIQSTSVGRWISVCLEAVESVGTGGAAVHCIERERSALIAAGSQEWAFLVLILRKTRGAAGRVGRGPVDGDTTGAGLAARCDVKRGLVVVVMVRKLIGMKRGRVYVPGGDMAWVRGAQETTVGLNHIWAMGARNRRGSGEAPEVEREEIWKNIRVLVVMS